MDGKICRRKVEDSKGFHKWGNKTPIYLWNFEIPGMEATIAPFSQDIANEVGLVLSMEHLMANYNNLDSTRDDHYTRISGNNYSVILQYQLCKIEAKHYESANGGFL